MAVRRSVKSSASLAMATLKQVLITVATAAVGVCATTLSVDPTAIVGAPLSAVTQISKPLEGKALEDFLAS